MPFLRVDLCNPDDIRAAIGMLTRLLSDDPKPTPHPLEQTMAEMKSKKIWRFLQQVANLEAIEFSLPELGVRLGLPSSKVSSLKAILAKPEQRLGVQIFEPAPSGSADAVGNPRYRMPEVIRQAIKEA